MMTSTASDFPISRPHSHAPHMQLTGILEALKNKSLDELHALLSDKRTYAAFLHSLEPVQHLEQFHKELVRNLANLASNNLDKYVQITELKNQCIVIRAEFACAKERLNEWQELEKGITTIYSSASLRDRLRDSALEIDNSSEELHHRLQAKEIGLNEFVWRYKKERELYHKRMLTHLAAKS